MDYEQITENDIDALLSEMRRRPDRKNRNPADELAYDWILPSSNGGPMLAVRLCTSLHRGEAQDAAIRVCIVKSPGAPSSERMLATLKRIMRTPGWRARVTARLRLAWQLLKQAPTCPACGGRTVPIRKKNNLLFWSCAKFPRCKGAKRGPKGCTEFHKLLSELPDEAPLS